MTLATRCTACGTVFRVVPDQLRVSEGWVRCGRCGEAFNALEAMVDWPQPPAPTPAPEPAPEAAPEPEPEPSVEPAAAFTAEPPEPSPVAHETGVFTLPPHVEVVSTDGAIEGGPAPVSGDAEAMAAEPEPEPAAEPASEQAAVTAQEPAPEPTPVATPAALLPDAGALPGPAPSFVLQAERAARWRRPGVRLALGVASLLAVLGLVAQGAYTFRDRIAAASPAARPWLQQACTLVGCRVGDYRQIDALSVESSALVRVDGAPVYRLSVTLRNRAAVEVAAPAFDLALTDAQGRQIARRVLTMADLDLPLRSLKPGTELPIQVPLGISGSVSGYTVEIFYP